ncbi:MAG: DNA-directed RNA polymerase subunit delta [Erysipelotrichaceae bacterium]|nr:DNA-directed RNA polymerase subunit delta [Erysipelotrichaceae bacterium]MBP1528899.1 DNA-directed RNA polymerase subunit delta [Erysipelotrichaceae bacterium]MBQ1322309.1 DNA-directed RNA polymerase subunit delta [Erysipelotrichaceae bacterium]MBQ1347123.1 DNA-directed RNA polymerase subunit delta [Erysipelotrichaceae bacterium]MBQ1625085.1 DNA-directed RNA polymerase subunit delta [Erysipelotrichaceae bacterium]
MASAKSMTDIAYDVISKKKRAVQFSKLWEEVSRLYGVSNDKVAQFYSDLTFDSRFASLKDNKWDLVERRKFAESHIDLSEIELGDDEPEEGMEEQDSPMNNSDEY